MIRMAVLEKEHGLLSTVWLMLGSRRNQFGRADLFIETAMRSSVKRIGPIGRGRFVSPMFIHPKPGRRILADIGLKRIPARLRDLLMTAPGRFDFRMKHQSIAAVRERLGVRRNDGRAGLLIEPRVRRSHARLQPKTIDRH